MNASSTISWTMQVTIGANGIMEIMDANHYPVNS